jgi:hypothetical protein
MVGILFFVLATNVTLYMKLDNKLCTNFVTVWCAVLRWASLGKNMGFAVPNQVDGLADA